MNLDLWITLGCFGFVAFAMLSGKIAPSVACGGAVCVLWITGVLSGEEVFRGFTAPNVLVLVGMMIVVGTLLRTGLMDRIASLVLRSRGNGLPMLLACAMAIPFVLCHFIGSVTALITVLPLLIALAEETGIPASRMVLPASIGAQAGQFVLPVGGGVAQFLWINEIAESLGSSERLGFWDQPLVRLPAALAVMIYVAVLGYKLLPERDIPPAEWRNVAPETQKNDTLPPWKETAVYGIFAACVILMGCSARLHVPMHFISTAAAVLCCLLNVCGERDYFRMVNWPLVFVIAFLMPMSTALHNSGAGEWMAGLLSGVFCSSNLFWLCGSLFLIVGLLTQVLDNTALSNLTVPIVIIACGEHGVSMLPAVCAVRAAALVSFCTPLASPASLTAYRLGGYSMKEMLRFTVPCVAIYGLITALWIPIYFSI